MSHDQAAAMARAIKYQEMQARQILEKNVSTLSTLMFNRGFHRFEIF